jgi:hypothetical protein
MSTLKHEKLLIRAKLNNRFLVNYLTKFYRSNPKKLTHDECEALWTQINFTLQTLN